MWTLEIPSLFVNSNDLVSDLFDLIAPFFGMEGHSKIVPPIQSFFFNSESWYSLAMRTYEEFSNYIKPNKTHQIMIICIIINQSEYLYIISQHKCTK